MGAAINVGEVYASLVRDLHADAHCTPGFEHGLHNARLIEAVRRAAKRGERQKVHLRPSTGGNAVARGSRR
jgi:hypothetical protein